MRIAMKMRFTYITYNVFVYDFGFAFRKYELYTLLPNVAKKKPHYF